MKPQVTDPTIVLDLLEAFRRSKTMFAAVELGVFDRLEGKPLSIAELSGALECNQGALTTLLESCVALGLLIRTGGTFGNSAVASTYLTSASPNRMTGYIRYSNNVMWHMWSHMEDAIRTGENRWKQTFNLDGPIFSHFFRTEQAMNEFLMGMHGFGMITSPQIVKCFDLNRYQTMCDLGGATGHLVIAACEAYPKLQGIVFDLPHALGLAKELTSKSHASTRIQIVGGDFFGDALPLADLYAVGRILHDWNEPKVKLLLKRIYDALPKGGALLVGEKIVNEERDGPRWALMQSLNMLICTEGKERSASEYEVLLREAGFSRISVATTNVPLDAILAEKE